MPSPGSALFRSELDAAIADLDPRLHGLENMVNDQMSDPLRTALNTQFGRCQTRRELLKAAENAIDRLEADTFPDFEEMELPAALFAELQQLIANENAAGGRFKQSQAVTSGTVTISEFKDVSPN